MRTSPHLLVGACGATDLDGRYRHAEFAIWDELNGSLADHPRTWCSPEEGAMVLSEEVEELRDEVRANHLGLARAEATQVGAMALRFIADLYEAGADTSARYRNAAELQRQIRPAVGPKGRALASSHEGFGFLLREYDALWSAVCAGRDAQTAAARVAATAVRFIAEIGVGAVAASGAGR